MTRENFGHGFCVVIVLVVSFLGGFVLAQDCQKYGNCTISKQNNDTEPTSTSHSQDMMTHTPKPLSKPKALNMLAEDQIDSIFSPTPLPLTSNKTYFTTTTTTSTTKSPETTTPTLNATAVEEPKGRALNFTFTEQSTGNVLSTNATRLMDDLSDVSIGDDDDEMHEMSAAKILVHKDVVKNTTLGICEKGGLTYENGEKLEHGCDSICTCLNGKMDCTDRCSGPFFRKGKKIDDPLCRAKDADDPCCSLLICATDTETEPLEICSFENITYNRGDTFNKNCSEICTCERAGKISCKPRCPPTKKTAEKCVELPDPHDSCCKQVLCDVTLDDHDTEKEEKTKLKLIFARYVNSTSIALKFDTKFDENATLPILDISDDKINWKSYQSLPGGVLLVKAQAKYIKLENSDDILTIQKLDVGPKPTDKSFKQEKLDSKTCTYKGKTFKQDEEYNDDCVSLCICKNSEMKCLKLECPTYFGVDVLDPNCVEWETVPPDFKASPPHCCPEKIRCKNNGSCLYKGVTYKNWDPLPTNVTGCEKQCYCEMGKLECQNNCPPVTALPPPTLPCPPNHAIISQDPENDCCKYWVCDSSSPHSEIVLTETELDKTNTTDMSYMDPFGIKVPSKILGPLVVYTNEDKHPANDSLNSSKPNVTSDENPFYHKMKNSMKSPVIEPSTSNPGKFKPSKNTQKPKDIKNSPAVFVTPPTLALPPSQTGGYFPQQQHIPFMPHVKSPPKSHIEIHGKGNPDDLLQFINQHPEISNYPHGSVLEIHNVPPGAKPKPIQRPPFIPQNVDRPDIVPYLIHQQNPVGHLNNNLPPGITLEHILQEIHKTATHPQAPIVPFSQFPGDHLLVAQQSGPVLPNRPNVTTAGFPPTNFPGNFPGFQPPQDEIHVDRLDALNETTIHLAFIIPSVIVGLHGRVEVRYTHEVDDDPNTWQLQVFAPPGDLIATPQLEFELFNLIPDTEYRIKITVTLRDINNAPTSRVYKIRTLKSTKMPEMVPIEPDLAISDINATWVTVVWRKFTDEEMQYIDGVQLRFKEIDGKIYAATPLIHRAVTSYTLENLKPNTKYEIGIFFIPFRISTKELHTANMLHFTTANEVDTYGFNVSLDISQIKSTSVEIIWSGVPYPEDKYVNIYRAIYQSDTGKEDHNTFKIAKRDSPTKTVIMDLKPGTRYRLWLEVYLTNGKTKTSNVQDFITKPRAAPSLSAQSQQDKLSRSELIENKGDYYGPLVIVAILAAIAILSTLILLLILVRRHNQNKAAITPPSTRVSQSAYDNPTYKVEIQQETMGL